MSDTAKRTVQIIADYLDKDPAEITGTSSFSDDFDMDSLAKMELIVAFEEAFAIEVADDRLEMIMTVQDAIDVIETVRAERAPSTL
jgi:acyl carrier protein